MPSLTSCLQIKREKLQFRCTLASCYICKPHEYINISEKLNRGNNFTVAVALLHTHLLQDTEQSSPAQRTHPTILPPCFHSCARHPVPNYRVSFVRAIERLKSLSALNVCLEMLMPHLECLFEAEGGKKTPPAHNQSNKIYSKYSHSSWQRVAKC